MEYGFPRELYSSQQKIIRDVVNTVQNNKMAIISSPTGTGKTLALLCAMTAFLTKNSEDNDNLFDLLNNSQKTKVYYCSRTHSQLSQVIAQLKECQHKYRSVILGSRRVYCVNKELSKITDNEILTDRCRQMVRDGCCEYYEREYYSGSSMDIEELRVAGLSEKFCPYYYAKNTASECEIVLLPYNLLFTREGRMSSEISLKGKIVVVDEAHNIYDAVVQLNSAEIEWCQINLISGAKGLSEDLRYIIDRLLEHRKNVSVETIKSATNFVIDLKISGFNMIEISEEAEKDKLAQKNDMRCIFEFIKFLKLLTFSDDFGRVIVDKSKIRFTCINPGIYFDDLKECKSVIFAGGTMEPISHLKGIFPDIQYFNYPPVSDNCVSVIISETVNQKPINLSFGLRNELIDDVICTIVSLTNPMLSGGVVIFVPSQQFMSLIKKSPKTSNFRRKVYFEDEISFDEFRKAPEMLVAVMGGSLSEGINFTDDICRLLIIVGVPFPTKTLELQERSKCIKDYETLVAMKTVNQAVGRAIRHKNDYAAIVFLDSRYQLLKDRLSPWLRSKTKGMKFGEALIYLHGFLKTQAAS